MMWSHPLKGRRQDVTKYSFFHQRTINVWNNVSTGYVHASSVNIFNLTKSQVMFYDTLKIGEAANIMLGDTVLNVVQTYRYLGHIITNNLSDEADMEDKMRGLLCQE